MKDKAEIKLEIEENITGFWRKYILEEYLEYSLKLLGILSRKRTLDIRRGQPAIWSAAIVYVIARLNFLFDPGSPVRLTPDVICSHFGTNKHSTGTKATAIELACNLGPGAKGLCIPEITDAFTVYRTPEGFLIPKNMVDNPKWEIEIMNEKESIEFEKLLEARQGMENERARKKKGISLNKPVRGRQLNLFEE